MWPEASRATAALIDGFAPLVVGRDPIHTGAIWRDLRSHAWWYGGAGIASFAVAAIDIALWDLKGQILGRSLVDLLGGPCRETLPMVASGHATASTIPVLADQVASWLVDGGQGVKVGFGKRGDARLGFDHPRDVDFVGALREAIGPDAWLMVDLGVRNSWTVPEAVRRVRAFEEHGLHWIEEPLGPDDPAGYATLRAKTTTAIAYGEREWSVRGLQRVIESGTCDVVGVDPGRAEGLTGFLAASRLAEAAGVVTNAHSWSSAIVQAASLAASWALPSCRTLESKPLANPMQHELAGDTGWLPAGGAWPLPDRPGLGVEIDPAALARMRLDA